MKSPIDVDFLPPGWRARRARRRAIASRAGVAVALLVALTCAEAALLYRRSGLAERLADVQARFDAARGRIGEVEELDRKKQELTSRLAVLGDVLRRTRGAVLVSTVTAAAPEGVVLHKLDYQVDDVEGVPSAQLSIHGTCATHVDVADFFDALDQARGLEQVRMVYSEEKDLKGDKEFVLVARAPGELDAPFAAAGSEDSER
jgi:Tfp pilus assembly protein PilN